MNNQYSHGNRIREMRMKRGLKQIELAEKAGISINSLRRYEANSRYPTILVLKKLSAALDVDIAELIDPIFIDATPDQDWAELDEKISNNITTSEERARYWEIIRQTAAGAGERMSKHKIAVLGDMDKLNELGQQEAAKRVKELTYIPDYQVVATPAESSEDNADKAHDGSF